MMAKKMEHILILKQEAERELTGHKSFETSNPSPTSSSKATPPNPSQ